MDFEQNTENKRKNVKIEVSIMILNRDERYLDQFGVSSLN